MSLHKLTFILAATLAVPAVAAAQDAAPNKTKTAKATLSETDLAVLQKHHSVNVMEIEMGKLALTKGGADVKKYSKALVADHQKADKAALALAKARGVKLEDHPAPKTDQEIAEHKAMTETMDKLKGLSGAEFDREFLTQMVSGHAMVAEQVKAAIPTITDAKLKTHMEGATVAVEKHGTLAKDLLAKAGPTPPAITPVKPAS
jgi:putative membrane protein